MIARNRLACGHSVNSEERAMDEPKTKSKRGFASMSPERQREIASKGGKSVPNEKRSFSQNPDLASAAGRKGGKGVAPENRSFSRDPALASLAGTKGGHALHGGKGAKKP
jgi:general stress protein YciG